MIGGGVTESTYPNTRVASTYWYPREWDDDATGGRYRPNYSWDYLRAERRPLEDRKNPKFWAIWFREFLDSLAPRPLEQAMLPANPLPVKPVPHCRSGPLPVREWKMKNWVQALKV